MRFSLVAAVAVLVSAASARAGDDGGYPTGGETQAAVRFARSLRGADGIARAIRALGEDNGPKPKVAAVVLTARAAAAMPKLLDAIAAVEAPGAIDRADVSERARAVWDILVDALCEGRRPYDEYQVDLAESPEVERRRDAARAALVGALARGSRRHGAVRAYVAVLESDEAKQPGYTTCEDRVDLIRPATAALVDLLQVPADRESALRVLASGDADPALARPALSGLVVDDQALPWAVIGLTRMGDNLASEAPRLAGMLSGPRIALALDALRVMAARARATLPALDATAGRLDSRCGAPIGLHELAQTVAAVGASDAAIATRILVPLMRCPFGLNEVGPALARLWPDGVQKLFDWFRGDELSACARIDIAWQLESAHMGLQSADTALKQYLATYHCRRDSPVSGGQSAPSPVLTLAPRPPVDFIARATQNFLGCRAEAHLPAIPVTISDAAKAETLAGCLEAYACGPARSSYDRTLNRCCALAFGAPLPSFCKP